MPLKYTQKDAFFQVYDKIKILSEGDFKMSKKAVLNNIYRMLKNSGVEKIYHDDSWMGPKMLVQKLEEWGVGVQLEKTEYYHNKDFPTRMPNGKRFVYNVSFQDNMGKSHVVPLQVTCAFVGKTGTSEDDKYELTYYFMV